MIDTAEITSLINAHYLKNDEQFENAIKDIIQSYEEVGMKYSATIIRKCMEETKSMSQSSLGNVMAQMEAQEIDYKLNPEEYAEPTWELAKELVNEEIENNV